MRKYYRKVVKSIYNDGFKDKWTAESNSDVTLPQLLLQFQVYADP